jgi:predicted DNA-binding transcriptional regulator AlpA
MAMRVLSYNEAAKRAGIVRRSLERQIAQGEGPAVVHISARRRGVLESDLEEWLLSRRRPAPGEAARKLNQPDEPACSTSEHKLQSDAPRKRGRPAGVKTANVAPDRVEATEAEKGAR